MATTIYEIVSPDGKPLFDPWTGLYHRPRSGEQPGHKLIFDDGARQLRFVDEKDLPRADPLALASDLDLETIKTWLKQQVDGKRLSVVTPVKAAPAKSEPVKAAPAPKVEPPKPDEPVKPPADASKAPPPPK